MAEPETGIWFPAKKQGWGWGLPVSWQGWVALFLFFALTLAGGLLLKHGIGLFLLYLTVVSGGFLAVCWIKGEKPTWR